MELNLQPSHPASFGITFPCDIELLLLLCCSGHKILSTLPASLAEHRPASSDAFSYRVFVLGMSLFLNRLRGHLFGWQQSPQSWQKIIEVNGGMSSIAWTAAFAPCGYPWASLSPVLCTPLLWSFMTPTAGASCPSLSVPQPTCLLLPSDCLLPLSDLYMGLVNACIPVGRNTGPS